MNIVLRMWIIQEWCDLGTLNNYASTQPYERPKGRSRIKDILIDVCKAGGCPFLSGCVASVLLEDIRDLFEGIYHAGISYSRKWGVVPLEMVISIGM